MLGTFADFFVHDFFVLDFLLTAATRIIILAWIDADVEKKLRIFVKKLRKV